MAIYTVHEPPPTRRPQRRGPDDFVFVRDGFHIWALLLTPFWLLRHRMWLALIGYVGIFIAVTLALRVIGVGGGMVFLTQVLLSLLVALEAGTLRRFALRRRKWREVGVVAGRSHEEAERRFFEAWVDDEVGPRRSEPSTTAAARTPPPRPPATPQSFGIVGLFPEPGSPR